MSAFDPKRGHGDRAQRCRFRDESGIGACPENVRSQASTENACPVCPMEHMRQSALHLMFPPEARFTSAYTTCTIVSLDAKRVGVSVTASETTIGINGIAHVMLTVSQFAAARAFYGKLLPTLGMTPVCDTDKLFYCVGARTAIGIQPTGSGDNGDRFVQTRVGLHHLCFRARSREDVDRLHDLLRQIGATIIQPPQEGSWAPGYYSVLFEDPDGIRLEANFVPGAGVLHPDVKFNPTAGYST